MTMTIVRELRPDPPMPCSALQTMSWLSDVEKPQPKEKTINIKNASAKAFLRPITSPMRANVTAQPMEESVYESATQLTESNELNSVPMVYRAVATMEVSTRDRKRPKQILKSDMWSALNFYFPPVA